MLARRLTPMLPAMTLAEALETTRIHRVGGLTGARTTVVTTRPGRAPHHPISDVGLIGGGPGAHAGRGVAGPPRRAPFPFRQPALPILQGADIMIELVGQTKWIRAGAIVVHHLQGGQLLEEGGRGVHSPITRCATVAACSPAI
jgi:hypothetical protein